MEVISWLIENWSTVIGALLMIVGGASIIAKLTPTKADDRVIDAILGFLNSIALNPKKFKGRGFVDIRLMFIVLMLVFVVLLTSCATWQKNTVTGYELTGTTIQRINVSASDMCNKGTLTVKQCMKILDVYSKTYVAYQTAGSLLKVAISADAATKDASLLAYTEAIAEFNRLLPELLKLAVELGVEFTEVSNE